LLLEKSRERKERSVEKPSKKESEKPMESTKKAYPSDVTDAEWEKREPLILAIAEDATPGVSERKEIGNAIVSVVRRGCPWRRMPHDMPTWGTVSDSFQQWKQDGTGDTVLATLRREVREREGREPEPSATVIDSQSLKTSAVRGPEKGDDAGKNIWGRTRPIVVDTLGLWVAVLVLAAEVGDREGAKRLLKPCTRQHVPRRELLWADQGSDGEPFATGLQEPLSCRVEILKQPWIERPGTWIWKRRKRMWQRDRQKSTGFQVIPRRWVVERSLAWITRWRRLARDHEGLPASSEAFITRSATQRMLSLLTRPALCVMRDKHTLRKSGRSCPESCVF
jgi:putative transposase